MFHRELKKPDGRSLHLYSLNPISDSIVATNPLHDQLPTSSELRWHPLRGEWVAFAGHRQNRTFLPPPEYSPLAVTVSDKFPTELPAGRYDVAVFENLFPSLSTASVEPPPQFVATEAGKGICEVVVFSQDPKTSLGDMPVEAVALVLEVIGERTRAIAANSEIKYVLPFENRGVEVGVTLNHPHGQIYSYPHVPPIPQKMAELKLKYWHENKSTLLASFIASEEKDGRRVIAESKHSIAFVPVCARYPYETWILPRRSVASLYDLNSDEREDLAGLLKNVLTKFDRMWNRPFPYLMSLYQAPTDGVAHPEWHTHFQIYPPYRNRERLKYLAGTELGAGMFVNDSYPEEKAAELRAVVVS